MRFVDAIANVFTLPTATVQRFGVMFGLLLASAAMPIAMTDLPPLADYANHLGRMHVIADIARNPDLSRLYFLEWAPIPNLIMDLVVPGLSRVLGIYGAGQAFMVMVLVLLVTGPVAIQKVLFGRISLWPLVAFPFVYNATFLTGLVNYLFGVGLSMWGLAAWIALRDQSVWRRAFISLVCVQILFVTHLFAVGVYGVGLLSYEAWRHLGKGPVQPRTLLPSALMLGTPFLTILPLLIASPTFGLSTENYWESGGKLQGLMNVFTTYGDVDLPILAVAAVLVWWGIHKRLLRAHPALWFLLAIGAAVYLAMPRMLFGSWMADERMPVAVFFLALGFVRLDDRDRGTTLAFLVFVIGMSLVRFIDIESNWMTLSHATSDLRAAVRLIDRGSSVLVAHADDPVGTQIEDDALSHAPCVAMIERDALVSTAFTVRGKQILGVKPNYRGLVDAYDGDPPTVSQLLATTDDEIPGQPHYWDRWPQRYEYLVVLYTGKNPNPDPDHLTLLHQGPRYQLYRIHAEPEDGEES